jgi:linoleoyl-CoA desaturase
LQTKVFDALKDKNIKTGSFNFWLKGMVWALVAYGSYLCLIHTKSAILFWGFYLTFQLAGLLIGFSLGHDASHNTAFKNKQSNQYLHFFSFLSIGIDPLLWGLRHIRSHHLYANVEGSDVDIDKNPFLRLAPSHPKKKKHQFQHFYAPFVYMLALLHSVFLGDWIYLFHKDYEWMRRGIPKKELYIRFFIFKICYFGLILFMPYYFTTFSLTFIFLTYITTSAFTSLLFVVMLVGTHFFYEAEYPESSEDELMSTWAVHQLKTSCDWHPNSAWARYLSGGSNCHAAHHLFPNICHTNYDKINHIIENTTQDYGLPYHRMSLIDMIKSHFKHLKKMGLKD